MFDAKLLAVALLLCGLFASTAEAKLFKWVDDKGITHYGETIPPEYADKTTTQLGKNGRVEKVNEVLTPEQRRAREKQAEQESQAQLEASRVKRRDATLLNTFSNVEEIDRARDRSLQRIQAQLDATKSMLDSAQEALGGRKKELAGLSRANKKIPAALSAEIEAAEKRIASLQDEQAQNQQKMNAVKTQFNEDKKRYCELKGISLEGSEKQ